MGTSKDRHFKVSLTMKYYDVSCDSPTEINFIDLEYLIKLVQRDLKYLVNKADVRDRTKIYKRGLLLRNLRLVASLREVGR